MKVIGRLSVVLLVGIGVLTGILAFDIYLVATGNRWGDHRFTVYAIPGGDTRERWEVVNDLRDQGVNVQLSAHPNRLSNVLMGPNGPILPLGGVADRLTVLCNETGRYVNFVSDEHGFNNPPGLWRDGVDVVLVGDSFTQGVCPPPEKHFAAQIRRQIPATVNLGSVANGPLAELATIREYVPYLRPSQVLWFYFEGNDLGDLNWEKVREQLAAYLDPSFRQDLIHRQAEVDAVLDSFFDSGLADRRKAPALSKAGPMDLAVDTLLLRHFRHFVKRRMFSRPEAVEGDYPLLTRVLDLAQQDVKKAGGRLTLLYLPQADLKHYGVTAPGQMQAVRDICAQLGIGFVDVRAEFLRRGRMPEFFYYPGSHYNEEGYSIVTEAALALLGKRRER